MATERLIVKNFGPIREADLDLRKVTVLIGEQASGKSVLAKLVAILRGLKIENDNYETYPTKRTDSIFNFILNDQIEDFGLSNFVDKNSYVSYQNEKFEVHSENGKFKVGQMDDDLKNIATEILRLEYENRKNQEEEEEAFMKNEHEEAATINIRKAIVQKNLVKRRLEFSKITFEPLYIPTERIAFCLASFDVEFHGNYLNRFQTLFQEKRRLKKRRRIFPFDMDYEFDEENLEEFVILKNGKKMPLSTSSSGIQCLVPLQIVIETANPILKHLFIIEEPELNLYPTTQKKLVEYLIEKCTQGDNRLIITTHSPYILTALNNCIQAKNVVDLYPDTAAEVNKLVPPQYQIGYQDVMAYYVGGGKAKPIMNEEFQMIDANALDDVSNELGRIFDSLLDLKYQHQE